MWLCIFSIFPVLKTNRVRVNRVVIVEKEILLDISNLSAMLENCQKKSLHNKFTNTSKASECMICKEQFASDSPNFVT